MERFVQIHGVVAEVLLGGCLSIPELEKLNVFIILNVHFCNSPESVT